MIKNRKDLAFFIQTDRSRYHLRKPFVLGWLLGDENFQTIIFLKRLRLTEYYKNTLNKHNPFSVLRYAWSFYRYRRMWEKLKLHVPLNSVGPGLYIPHRGGWNIY